MIARFLRGFIRYSAKKSTSIFSLDLDLQLSSNIFPNQSCTIRFTRLTRKFLLLSDTRTESGNGTDYFCTSFSSSDYRKLFSRNQSFTLIFHEAGCNRSSY